MINKEMHTKLYNKIHYNVNALNRNMNNAFKKERKMLVNGNFCIYFLILSML